MTHTITAEDKESGGSFASVFATVDITSLDNAASEDFDPAAELGVRSVVGVSVLGLENAGTYQAEYDHVAGDTLAVQNVDGTDPTSGTDVGEVQVRVDGNLGP
ncbi:hypothetical protein OSG_eHP18_00005 [environmental Halophage eHP-18]|nr:hypothetical protein OSG_eHP18_00005 [environmental Halophage eHP-18]